MKDELADVLSYCYLLADRLGLDPRQVILDKLAQTRAHRNPALQPLAQYAAQFTAPPFTQRAEDEHLAFSRKC